jgi:hypothetical protein
MRGPQKIPNKLPRFVSIYGGEIRRCAMIQKINNYSGILTVVTFISAIVFHFSWVKANITDLKLDQDENTQLIRAIRLNIEREIIYRQQLLEISKKSAESIERTNVILSKLVVALDNINNNLK